MAFFSSTLPKGKHTFRRLLRAETPGAFHALPARVECMYAPEISAHSAMNVVRIVEREADSR